MTTQTTAVVITPATWSEQVSRLKRTTTGLLNVVGWFGSTHAAARWRKAPEFLAVFEEQGIAGFDPQIDDWQPHFAATEAEVMATASVIVIRLENKELLNGSLGSIAETGLALISAVLRGQVVIVSIEDGLLASLTDPGAIAQLMMLEMFLEEITQIEGITHFLLVHRGNNLGELAALAGETARQQLDNSLTGLNFADFLAKKSRRRQNYPRRVLLGGSGGPYAEVYQDRFKQKQQQILMPYRENSYRLKSLSDGPISRAWKIPYGSNNALAVALAMRALLSIEFEYKEEADILLLPIMAEADSKAAATEIGFLLLQSLTSGQEIKIILEPFDPVDYLRHQLKHLDAPAEATEKAMRQALQGAGVTDSLLATAVQAEIFAAYHLVQGLQQHEAITFKQLKQSLLGQTETFLNADNIRRVRTLVQAHLEHLYADERYPGFLTYTNQITPLS